MKAAAVYDYAGAFSIGIHEAGLTLDVKCEDATGFGMEPYAANLALVGWPDLVADDPGGWPPRDVDVVFANPPCSAFSSFMLDPKYANMGSAGLYGRQNSCMYDVINYAARCLPDTVIIESVQAAGRAGRPLMRDLRKRLEALTHRKYTLTYVFMNVLSVGGYQNRPRFFCVMRREGPLHVQPATGYEMPLSDVIGDLRHDRSPRSTSPRAKRLSTLAAYTVDGETIWKPGMSAADAYNKALELGYRQWPMGPDGRCLGRSDQIRSPFTAWRWRWDQVAQVVTGGFLEDRVHPLEPRMFTYREAARLMGFPDTWKIEPVVQAGARGKTYFGKGVTVQAALWIGRSVLNPGPVEAMRIEGDDEWVVDVTASWKGNRPPVEQLAMFDVTGPDGYVDESIKLTPTGKVSRAKKRDKIRR